MENLLIQYGLLALIILAAIEGDATFVIAGILAHLGYLNFFAVVVVGGFSAFMADCVWFWLGHSHSEFILRNHRYQRVGPQVERLTRRFRGWELIMSRFVYGTRIASAMFWGVHKFSFARFVLLDSISCLAWALLLTSIGFFLGKSAEALLGHLKRVEIWLLIALVGIGLVFLVGKLIMRREVD
jgi:membrane protein DedA with SNARE-associated domain